MAVNRNKAFIMVGEFRKKVYLTIFIAHQFMKMGKDIKSAGRLFDGSKCLQHLYITKTIMGQPSEAPHTPVYTSCSSSTHSILTILNTIHKFSQSDSTYYLLFITILTEVELCINFAIPFCTYLIDSSGFCLIVLSFL